MSYISSGPLDALLLAHPQAIERWRELMGPTKPTIAQVVAPSSIRSLHGLTDTRNSVHGSGECVVINHFGYIDAKWHIIIVICYSL